MSKAMKVVTVSDLNNTILEAHDNFGWNKQDPDFFEFFYEAEDALKFFDIYADITHHVIVYPASLNFELADNTIGEYLSVMEGTNEGTTTELTQSYIDFVEPFRGADDGTFDYCGSYVSSVLGILAMTQPKITNGIELDIPDFAMNLRGFCRKYPGTNAGELVDDDPAEQVHEFILQQAENPDVMLLLSTKTFIYQDVDTFHRVLAFQEDQEFLDTFREEHGQNLCQWCHNSLACSFYCVLHTNWRE